MERVWLEENVWVDLGDTGAVVCCVDAGFRGDLGMLGFIGFTASGEDIRYSFGTFI